MIYTLYSFKGGVGRSMALANLAEVLRQKGNRVVMIDWDLEAPGLETFFYKSKKDLDRVRSQPGLIDFLEAYKSLFPKLPIATELTPHLIKLTQETNTAILNYIYEDKEGSKTSGEFLNILKKNLQIEATRAEDKLAKEISDAVALKKDKDHVTELLERYIQSQHLPRLFISFCKKYVPSFLPLLQRMSNDDDPKKSGLWLFSAGWRYSSGHDQFTRYASQVMDFNWTEFYQVYKGDLFFEWVKSELADFADIVLIDSRTGVTEMGGVCTKQLADLVVLLTAPNYQNMNGVLDVARSVYNYKLDNQGLQDPAKKNISSNIVIIPSRLDVSELQRRNQFEDYFKKVIYEADFLKNIEPNDFWNLGIPYVPYYAYNEDIIIGTDTVRSEAKGSVRASELERAYINIAEYLIKISGFSKSTLPVTEQKPYCYVITSFGKKQDLKGLQSKFEAKDVTESATKIDFDAIYNNLIVPAIRQAGMEPLAEREEMSYGVVQKLMYEQIIMCECCIADLTNANPNVYYELGLRQTVSPGVTIPIIASTHLPIPVDLGFDRVFSYQVDKNFKLVNASRDIEVLATILQKASVEKSTGNLFYNLVNSLAYQNSGGREKTDLFRDNVVYDKYIKNELRNARETKASDELANKKNQVNAINAVIERYGPLQNIETGILVDIMLSFRDISAFDEMLAFIKSLPRYAFKTILFQEQYAFVLNRLGGRKKPADEVMIAEAESVLKELESNGKASSETYAIWGRIYRDKMDRAYQPGNLGKARIFLEKALALYKKGFEADVRNGYVGVNYITCLVLSGQKKAAERLVPAVEAAVSNQMVKKEPDFWDFSTLVELAVIENRFDAAADYVNRCLALDPFPWMLESTKANLNKIIAFSKERNEDTAVAEQVIALLDLK